MATGGCLCGAVRFKIEGDAGHIQLCHAARCQKATGAASSPEMAIEPERFRWISGEDKITRYTAPLLERPPAYHRAFCSVCGSPAPIEHEELPFVGVLAGTLDPESGARPAWHAFVDQCASWETLSDDGLERWGMRPERRG